MNLFIGNLNPQTTEDSLRVLFSEFGEIVSIKIPIDTETGLPRGFGFVEMADKFESFDAIDNIDGTYFEGQVISVKESKPKNAPGGNNRGGGGFNRGGNSRGGGGGFNRGGSGGGFNRDRNGGGGFNRDRSSGDRSSGGGFNRDRSSGGGFNRDRSSGGGFNRDRSSGGGFNRERSSGDRDNSYRRPYNNDQPGNDSNSGSEDPNRQPGRRFSPRGPRPSNDN